MDGGGGSGAGIRRKNHKNTYKYVCVFRVLMKVYDNVMACVYVCIFCFSWRGVMVKITKIPKDRCVLVRVVGHTVGI